MQSIDWGLSRGRRMVSYAPNRVLTGPGLMEEEQRVQLGRCWMPLPRCRGPLLGCCMRTMSEERPRERSAGQSASHRPR